MDDWAFAKATSACLGVIEGTALRTACWIDLARTSALAPVAEIGRVWMTAADKALATSPPTLFGGGPAAVLGRLALKRLKTSGKPTGDGIDPDVTLWVALDPSGLDRVPEGGTPGRMGLRPNLLELELDIISKQLDCHFEL